VVVHTLVDALGRGLEWLPVDLDPAAESIRHILQRHCVTALETTGQRIVTASLPIALASGWPMMPLRE
jgi:hypothetical protein